MGQGRENSEIYLLLRVTGKPYLTFNKCIRDESKWKFKMAFARKGGGSRGGLECHIPILKNDLSNFIQEVHLQNLEKVPSPSEISPLRIFREIEMFTIPNSSAPRKSLFYCHNTLPIRQRNRYIQDCFQKLLCLCFLSTGSLGSPLLSKD